MPRAIWNDAVLAESDDTVIVEGNHYFPPDAINKQYFKPSSHQTFCSWKGECSYYDIEVNGQTNENAAWCYVDPKPAADQIRGRIAFWRGVKVES